MTGHDLCGEKPWEHMGQGCDTAEAMVCAAHGAWSPVPVSGSIPSHRQSLALCGSLHESLGKEMMEMWESLNGDSFLETMNVLDLRTLRWDNPWKDQQQICKPCARRNPAGVTLGRHFIISGGYSEEQVETLGDTWTFDMKKGSSPCKRRSIGYHGW
eukprot:Skav212075  [mRNA]  locus=scaffold867:84127:90107:+ [translate_table: standard]